MEEEKKRKSNLRNIADLSPEERREFAIKGGKASAASAKRRRTLRQELEQLLASGDTQKRISVALIEAAMTGSASAFTAIRDSIGEKPRIEVDAEVAPGNMIHDLEELSPEEREFIARHHGENTPLGQSIARSLSMNARQQLLGELLE